MRIIAGEKRGTQLASIKGDWIRPTSDKIRGAVFSSLFSLSDPQVFTELFAGSGAMGIEALSRGIPEVWQFDNNRKSIDIIKKNLEKTGYTDKTNLCFMSAAKGLRLLAEKNIASDVIFMDPPYKDVSQTLDLMTFIHEQNLLTPDGIIMIEHDKNDIMPIKSGKFDRIKEKKYGTTVITTYGKSDA